MDLDEILRSLQQVEVHSSDVKDHGPRLEHLVNSSSSGSGKQGSHLHWLSYICSLLSDNWFTDSVDVRETITTDSMSQD